MTVGEAPAGSDELGAAIGGEDLAVSAASPVHPYVHVVVMAIIGALGVLAWLFVYEAGLKLLWENEAVTANRWLVPAICLPFSLLAGILVKRFRAPTSLDESMLDTFTGDVAHIDWRGLPVNVVMAWVSLFSGAVLGPEGGIGGIATKLSALYAERVGIPVEHRSRLVFSTTASAFNGLIANPLFAGVLGSELMKDEEAKARNLPANLIGGSIGFLIFTAFGLSGFQDILHLHATEPLGVTDALLSVVLGLVGLVLAILAGGMFRVVDRVLAPLRERPVERALLAGIVFSLVGMTAPILLFSGETQIVEVSQDAAAYGTLQLLAMAFAKLALLAVAFRGGFLGGPTFPAVFAAVCVGLAIDQVMPGVRVDVVIGSLMAGFLVVFFRAPFMVILLTAVMLAASPEVIALIILAVAAPLIAQPYVVSAMQARKASRAAARGARTAG